MNPNRKDKRRPTAITPRPNNQPIYLDGCVKCFGELELFDHVFYPNTPQDEIYHDEFYCRKCNLLHMDLSPEDTKQYLEQNKKIAKEWDDIYNRTLKYMENPANQEKIRVLLETLKEFQEAVGIKSVIPELDFLKDGLGPFLKPKETPVKNESNINTNTNMFGSNKNKIMN